MRCLNAGIFSDVSVNENNVGRPRIRSRLSSTRSLTPIPYSSMRIKNATALIPEEISNKARFSHVVGNYGGLDFR